MANENYKVTVLREGCHPAEYRTETIELADTIVKCFTTIKTKFNLDDSIIKIILEKL